MPRKKTKKAKKKANRCPDCGVLPGHVHLDGCDIETCTVCGRQYIGCECRGHDKRAARWTGSYCGDD